MSEDCLSCMSLAYFIFNPFPRLDRCRTAINVLGDMTVSALIDGKHRRQHPEEPQLPELPEAENI